MGLVNDPVHAQVLLCMMDVTGCHRGFCSLEAANGATGSLPGIQPALRTRGHQELLLSSSPKLPLLRTPVLASAGAHAEGPHAGAPHPIGYGSLSPAGLDLWSPREVTVLT